MKSRKPLWVSLTVVFGLLTVALTVGTVVLNQFETVVNQALGIETRSIGQGDSDANYFKPDFKTADEQRKDALSVCLEVEEEGITLLKNDASALPLSSGSKVSVLGQTSVDFISGGTGSSASNKTDDTVQSSLKDAGFQVNDTLTAFYNEGAGKEYRRHGLDGALNNVIKDNATAKINEVPLDKYSDAEWNSIAGSEAIIVMLGRQCGEGGDVPFFGSGDGTGNHLELTQEERDLLGKAKELKDAGKAQKIVVVLNTSNPLELDFLSEEVGGVNYGIDAALWIGGTGSNGIKALGEVLVGSVNPSGHLPDTWAFDNLTSPAMQNTYISEYSNAAAQGLAYDGSYNSYYEVYQEGIYVGYKYYETRYEDVVLGADHVGAFDYGSTVAYPFGYGLSYSSFAYSNYKVEDAGENYKVTVDVQNTSAREGKEVVQVYLQKPYTAYDKEKGIEQAAVQLVGYEKASIPAGETKSVEVLVSKEEFKTYDAEGHKTYIVEAGDYYLAVGNGSHEAVNNILGLKKSEGKALDEGKLVGATNASLAHKVSVSEDLTTYAKSKNGTAVTNQFDHADLNRVDDDANNDVNYVSRQDWAGTMPEANITSTSYKAAVVLAANDLIASGLKQGYVADTATQFPKSTFNKEGELSLVQFRGVGKDETITYKGTTYTWDDLLDQISFPMMAKLVGVGFHNTAAIKTINKPATHDENGAQGFTMSLVGGASSVAFPSEDVRAATFNKPLQEKMGVSLGNSAFFGANNYLYSGLYAPNANIHRTPYGGRNFEYFSEDGFLSGEAMKAEVKGIQSKGVYVYMKHFVLNDQETGRDGISVWANEQAIREIYLKPFQMAIEAVDAHCVMTSFNRIGFTWAGADGNLLLNVLKGEWGMDGMALTDYSNNNYMGVLQGLQNGSDIWDCSSTKWQDLLNKNYASDPAMQYYIRRAAKNILYTVVNSNAMNGIGVDTTIQEVIPWWKPTLIALDVTFGVLTLGSVAMLVLCIVRDKKNKAKSI